MNLLFPLGVGDKATTKRLDSLYHRAGLIKPRSIIDRINGGQFVDISRYLLVASSIKAFPPEVAAVVAGLLLSPNLVNLAFKSRMIREAGKTVGRYVAKEAKAVPRKLPRIKW